MGGLHVLVVEQGSEPIDAFIQIAEGRIIRDEESKLRRETRCVRERHVADAECSGEPEQSTSTISAAAVVPCRASMREFPDRESGTEVGEEGLEGWQCRASLEIGREQGSTTCRSPAVQARTAFSADDFFLRAAAS
jgi:hypothetical protein